MPLTIVPGRLTQIPGQTYSLLAIPDLDTTGAVAGNVPTFDGVTVVWSTPGTANVPSSDDFAAALLTFPADGSATPAFLTATIATTGATERLDVSVTLSATTDDGNFAQLIVDVQLDAVSIGETAVSLSEGSTSQIEVFAGAFRRIVTVGPGSHTIDVLGVASQPAPLGTNVLIDPTAVGQGQHASLVIVRLGP